MSGSRRIGLLGGTFDPIHIGHLRAAVEAIELLNLDEIRLIPSARPPHRGEPQTAAVHRLQMVELAIAGMERMSADDRELKRDRPSYTVETLTSFRQELGEDVQLMLLLGWDAFCGLPGWYQWEQLLNLCHVLVLQRPDADTEAPEALKDVVAARSVSDPLALTGPAGQISFVRQAPLEISATRIRERLQSGRSVRFLTPDTVLHYIQMQGLYPASPN
jgi:nicotinate-nucleotide adenylyltransferase